MHFLYLPEKSRLPVTDSMEWSMLWQHILYRVEGGSQRVQRFTGAVWKGFMESMVFEIGFKHRKDGKGGHFWKDGKI